MKNRLLWSWSTKDDRSSTRNMRLSAPVEKFVLFLLLAVLIFLMMRFIVPMFGVWVLIPLVFVVSNLVLNMSHSKRMTDRFFDDDFSISIYDDGIDLKMPDAHGFYRSDDIDLSTLNIGSFAITFAEAQGPVLGFETLSPAMTVTTSLQRMSKQKRGELEQFISRLKFANAT